MSDHDRPKFPAPRAAAPPAWHQDPGDPRWLRWWDGQAWTDWRHPAPIPDRSGSVAARIGWSIAVAAGGGVLWFISIAMILLESEDEDKGLERIKVLGGVGFFSLPVAVVVAIAAIWLTPRSRQPRP